MNKNTKLLFLHKLLYDVYFYGAITIPFFVAKGYGVTVALAFAAIYMISSIITEVPTGVIGDKYGHKQSILFGAFLIGCALAALLILDNLLWDGVWIVLFAAGSALVSGSDTALLRFSSDNFERDNRTFDYLKSVMLLLSFGAAGFVAKYASIEIAIGLSSLLAFVSMLPLLFVNAEKPKRTEQDDYSITKQIKDLPKTIRKVNGGVSLILLAGLVGSVLFSAKEVISSLNTIYGVDIGIVGVIAALAMAGRIVGTTLEKRMDIGQKVLLALLSFFVFLTAAVDLSVAIGVLCILLSTVTAQMLFYRLNYKLASEAPDPNVASLVSSLGLVGRLSSGGILLVIGLLAGVGLFHVSFIVLALVLAIARGFLVRKLER